MENYLILMPHSNSGRGPPGGLAPAIACAKPECSEVRYPQCLTSNGACLAFPHGTVNTM